MNIKFANIPLILVMVLMLPVVAAAQRISSLKSTAKGEGTITVADEKHKINAVLVILKENGEADITLYTDLQLFAQGTWSAGEDISQGIDLKITGGIVSGNASGTGKLFLHQDMKSIAKLSISAASSDRSVVKVEFTAEPPKGQ